MKNLGFGMMRLPVISGPTDFDFEELNKMVDAFLDAGYTYFDTSFVVLVNLNCNRSSDFYDFCRRQSIVVRMRAHVVVPTICICIYLTVQLLFGWERF